MVDVSASDLALTSSGGTLVVDGVVGNLFPDGSVGDGPSYRFVEVRNNSTSFTVTGGRVWLVVDSGGGDLAIAMGSASAIATGAAFTLPATGSLSFSSPTSQSTGLAVPDLAPGTKALVCVRRDLTSATTKRPEVNRITFAGTAPIGY